MSIRGIYDISPLWSFSTAVLALFQLFQPALIFFTSTICLHVLWVPPARELVAIATLCSILPIFNHLQPFQSYRNIAISPCLKHVTNLVQLMSYRHKGCWYGFRVKIHVPAITLPSPVRLCTQSPNNRGENENSGPSPCQSFCHLTVYVIINLL